jgi:hypothetical protein
MWVEAANRNITYRIGREKDKLQYYMIRREKGL